MTMTDYSRIYDKAGIWELWRSKEWEDYDIPHYRDTIKKFVDEEAEHNVILYGANGTGKTMLMNIAMRKLLHKEYGVYVIDFRHLIREYIASWRDKGKLSSLLLCDYLAIDDIGKEFSGGDVSKELATTTLDYVLRYRAQRQLPTWMTFNMALGDVKSVYNEHIASLLKRSSVAVLFEGEDYGERLFKVIKPNAK